MASNVNFGIGTVDPNVAVAKIGADGMVCFSNSKHTNVHLVADHLGTIPADSYTPATASGAPDRKVDTREPEITEQYEATCSLQFNSFLSLYESPVFRLDLPPDRFGVDPDTLPFSWWGEQDFSYEYQLTSYGRLDGKKTYDWTSTVRRGRYTRSEALFGATLSIDMVGDPPYLEGETHHYTMTMWFIASPHNTCTADGEMYVNRSE